MAASAGAQRQATAPVDQPFDLRETFVGMDASLGFLSPDIAFAAGWQHLVIARNSGIALFRKGNSEPSRRLAGMLVGDFFSRVSLPGDRLTDPYLLFDRDDGRFFFVLAQMNQPMAILMAVSKSAYPETLTESDWYLFRLARNEDADEADFDKLAVAGDTLLVSWQRTGQSASGPVGLGTRIRLFDKRQLMSGVAPTGTVDLGIVGNLNYRARPAAVETARDRQSERDRVFYDIYRVCGSTNRETWLIGAITGIGTTPRLDTREIVSPFPCENTPVFAPQPGGGRQVRFPHIATNPVYHDGRLWLFEPAGGSNAGTTTGIHWMELDVRGWPDAVRVVQSGRFNDPSVWSYVPSAAVDWEGNLVMTYVRSSANDFLSAYYTGRLVTDAQGALRPGRPLQTGTRSWRFDGNFLDFSTATVDPVDGSVWITGSVPSATLPVGSNPENSDTWVGRLLLSSSPPPAPPAPGAPSALTASSSDSSVTLSWRAPGSGGPLTSYSIEAGSAPELDNLTKFSTGSTATSYSASPVVSGTYYVRVRAANAAGTGPPSNEAQVIVGTGCSSPPDAPAALMLTANSGGTVTLSWNTSTGNPATYILEAGSAPGLSNLANSDLGGTSTTFATAGVARGTYYVRVRAKNACGTSSASSEIVLVV